MQSNAENLPLLLKNKIIRSDWREVNEEFAKQVLAKREQMVPLLVDLVKERKYWDALEPESWAPITAIHLLSLSKDKRALEALIYVLRNFQEELGDWLTEDMPSLLAHFGVDGFDTFQEIVLDEKGGLWPRDVASRAMIVVADKSGDPNLRARAIACLKQAIQNERERETRSWFASELAELKDNASLPFIKSLCDKQLVDPQIVNYPEVEEIYAGHFDGTSHLVFDTKDPMDYFRDDSNVSRLLARTYGEDEKEETRKVSSHSSSPPNRQQIQSKVGRNDPCPCGSGKKYKKCCLQKDIKARRV